MKSLEARISGLAGTSCLGEGRQQYRGLRGAFTQHLKKAVQKSLQASGEFCLLVAKDRSVQRAMLWRDRAVQNRKPSAIAFRSWRGFACSNPNPIGGSVPPASAASAFVGHAIGGFADQPDFADSFSCSDFGIRTIRNARFQKVRNSERRFYLLIPLFVRNVVCKANFSPRQMNKFLKEPKQYTVMLHARHLCVLETSNTQ